MQDQRVDLGELKMQIVKMIGVERSTRYFYYLGRFLSLKLTKTEFDKSCCRLLGRENLALHNKLIRSILRNASLAKSPPPGKDYGPEQSGSLLRVSSNGVLPKVRSGTCDRTMRDRPSPLGPNGKVGSLFHQPLCRQDKSSNRNTEYGVGRLADERGGAFLCPAEKRRIPDKGTVAAPVSRDDEAQEERGRLILSRNPVTAPLGIPFCPASIGGGLRTVPVSTGADFLSCYDSGGLSDTEMLRKRMENIAVTHGIGGVSPECPSMLNNILDMYLKKLIKSCIDLAGARSINPGKPTLDKQQSRDEIVNRLRPPTNSLHIQTSNQSSDITQEQHPGSLFDFRVAMEVNPQQLGEDWPLLRERISVRLFEEQEGV